MTQKTLTPPTHMKPDFIIPWKWGYGYLIVRRGECAVAIKFEEWQPEILQLGRPDEVMTAVMQDFCDVLHRTMKKVVMRKGYEYLLEYASATEWIPVNEVTTAHDFK